MLKLRDEFGKTMEEIGTAAEADRSAARPVLRGHSRRPTMCVWRFAKARFALRHCGCDNKDLGSNARSLLIQRSGVKSLRVNTMATVAALPSALLGANGETVVPKEVRAFVPARRDGQLRAAVPSDCAPESQDAVKSASSYLGRFAARCRESRASSSRSADPRSFAAARRGTGGCLL